MKFPPGSYKIIDDGVLLRIFPFLDEPIVVSEIDYRLPSIP